jgi:NAD(P)-dependent dehydrogenase (short-subunit alcohol dehydrogenase family)
MDGGQSEKPAPGRRVARMEVRLDGKVALVTGASRGIGKAIAAQFALAGAKVMLSSRKPEALEQACAEISDALARQGAEAAAGEVAWHAANAGDVDQADECVRATVERFGSVDVLVNNAATNPYFGRMIEIEQSQMSKTVLVNQEAVLNWTKLAWNASMRDRGGVVLNISSVGGLMVEPGIGWYNVTKAAVAHMTRQLAGELGPAVRVNALAPGLVKTDFARALWEPAGDAVARRLPTKRLGEPEDIAKAALFLCSDAASWITGDVLVIDGGAMVVSSGGI